MKQQIIIPVIVTTIIAGALGFFGGITYQKNQRAGMFEQFPNGQGRMMIRGGSGNSGGRMIGQGFRPVNGEIIKADDTSITVKLPDGSSKIIIVPDTTAINKEDSGVRADLRIGEAVAVFGTENSDGSVTAQNIQLNPRTRMFGGNLPDTSPQPSP